MAMKMVDFSAAKMVSFLTITEMSPKNGGGFDGDGAQRSNMICTIGI